MYRYGVTGITCLIVGSTLFILGTNSVHAKSPDPKNIIRRVTDLLNEEMRSPANKPRSGQLRRTAWKWSFLNVRHAHPNSRLIRQLVANAICRQHKPSIKLAHRLDGHWEGFLFGYHQALIANEIARRQGLAIRFGEQFASRQNQTLNEINKTRHVKHTLSELGSAAAMKYTSSLYYICRETAAHSNTLPTAK